MIDNVYSISKWPFGHSDMLYIYYSNLIYNSILTQSGCNLMNNSPMAVIFRISPLVLNYYTQSYLGCPLSLNMMSTNEMSWAALLHVCSMSHFTLCRKRGRKKNFMWTSNYCNCFLVILFFSRSSLRWIHLMVYHFICPGRNCIIISEDLSCIQEPTQWSKHYNEAVHLTLCFDSALCSCQEKQSTHGFRTRMTDKWV